jgi:alkanesulfonate monooxygenase SsuD/methylene tetrahydromethanopterin reductase-like flavin-dependent oxidoreductase (luciferase family)
MDIGVGLPTTVPSVAGKQLIDYAQRADRYGFSTLAVIDRLVYDSYDNIVALAAAAAVTERIKLATTILLAAYRPSVVELGKQLASVDRLSGGRLVVGVAAGGRPDDFEATGVDYHTRGRRLDEMLEQLKRIWAGDMDGMGPKPTGTGIPVWVGGHSPAALRRAAKHGAAWISPGGSSSAYPDLVAKATVAFRAEGRAENPHMVSLANVALGEERKAKAVEYLLDYYSYLGPKAQFLANSVVSTEERLREVVDGFRAAGCDELLLFPCTGDPEHLDLIAKVTLA